MFTISLKFVTRSLCLHLRNYIYLLKSKVVNWDILKMRCRTEKRLVDEGFAFALTQLLKFAGEFLQWLQNEVK